MSCGEGVGPRRGRAWFSAWPPSRQKSSRRLCSIFVPGTGQVQNSDAAAFLAPQAPLRQVAPATVPSPMPPAGTSTAADISVGRRIKLMAVLWLAGVAMRMTILAMPPVIPQVHEELHLSETQVGLLIGLPLALFAVAAVPGSLLIARIGTMLAVIIGMVIAALAGAARAAAVDVWTLYAAVIATGIGVAIMQPAMPTLVRAWLPRHIAL